jgi:hypothetical protein
VQGFAQGFPQHLASGAPARHRGGTMIVAFLAGIRISPQRHGGGTGGAESSWESPPTWKNFRDQRSVSALAPIRYRPSQDPEY